MLDPEDQLILLLATGKTAPAAQAHARRLLECPLDWDKIVARVIKEGLYPLFYRNLDALGLAGVPVNVRSQLHRLSKINALRQVIIAEELMNMLKLLADAAIPAIPLKGVKLAELLYGDRTARVCGDIDILIPRHLIAGAFRCLRDAGYAPHDGNVVPTEIQSLFESNMEYSFVRCREGITFLIELHWDIAWRWGKGSIVIDDLWAEAQPRQYWGVEGYGLSPEWELLYLTVHAARHQWQGLKWLVDIHEMSANLEIDWEKLRAKANRLDLERTLTLTLSACHKLFGTSIAADLSVSSLPEWMKIFPESDRTSDIWKSNFFPARLFKGPSNKIRYLARVALLPTLAEARLLPLPQYFRFMHYFLRPLRLACKWGWAWLPRSRELGAGSRELGVDAAQKATGA